MDFRSQRRNGKREAFSHSISENEILKMQYPLIIVYDFFFYYNSISEIFGVEDEIGLYAVYYIINYYFLVIF